MRPTEACSYLRLFWAMAVGQLIGRAPQPVSCPISCLGLLGLMRPNRPPPARAAAPPPKAEPAATAAAADTPQRPPQIAVTMDQLLALTGKAPTPAAEKKGWLVTAKSWVV